MKREWVLLLGVLTMVPALAVADYCRDCGSGYHPAKHKHAKHKHVSHKHAKQRYQVVHHIVRPGAHHAGEYRERRREHKYRYNRSATVSAADYARVIDVEPVYRYYTQTTEYGSCVQRNSGPAQRASWTPAILGAVIGGAVGHRIGDSYGDADVAAVAGGLLGASVGHDVARHNRDARGITVRGPCRSYEREEYRRKPVEYVVTYRYNGQVYRIHMDHHPGDWVELDVKIKPA